MILLRKYRASQRSWLLVATAMKIRRRQADAVFYDRHPYQRRNGNRALVINS
jgi:hypothetical protein